jgi:hypothetical protein
MAAVHQFNGGIQPPICPHAQASRLSVDGTAMRQRVLKKEKTGLAADEHG